MEYTPPSLVYPCNYNVAVCPGLVVGPLAKSAKVTEFKEDTPLCVEYTILYCKHPERLIDICFAILGSYKMYKTYD